MGCRQRSQDGGDSRAIIEESVGMVKAWRTRLRLITGTANNSVYLESRV